MNRVLMENKDLLDEVPTDAGNLDRCLKFSEKQYQCFANIHGYSHVQVAVNTMYCIYL